MTEEHEANRHRIRMADYDYHLPQELIAQTPLEDRTASRMLVLDRRTGVISHSRVRELPAWLKAGDLLVFNDSRVIPARLRIQRHAGGNGELLLLQRGDQAGSWMALGRPARRLRPSEQVAVVRLDGDRSADRTATILDREESGLFRVQLEAQLELELEAYGAVPLPPYITAKLADRERYQTVYGKAEGSAAAPTAGLHFTDELLEVIRAKGIETAFVTLHVGLDTFRPVTVDYAEEHDIHSEWCSVSGDTVRSIMACKARGGRVVPVGTTSARTLETLGQHLADGQSGEFSGPTSIFITPGHEWKVVDGLFTNFHLPKSTLMLMVSALAGRDNILRAYHEAIDERYRFYSFGDAMLIV